MSRLPKLPPSTTLESTAAEHGEGTLTEHGKVELQKAAADMSLRRCHEMLVEPINDLLAGESRLALVPSGDLFAFPFAALRDVNGKHLIEHHVIHVAPSIGTIIELEQRGEVVTPNDHVTALIIGDPAFNHADLPQLHNTHTESKEICQMFSSSAPYVNVTILQGDKATKQNIKAGIHVESHSYIHLATHGDSDGLYFAPTSAECSSDSSTCKACKIGMDEVQPLDLRQTKLVVLSGCDTLKRVCHKGTQISRGISDGVVGITRAFVAAGVPTVLASLWKVDDMATRALMIRFYRLLLGETAGDPAVALQHAGNDCNDQGTLHSG